MLPWLLVYLIASYALVFFRLASIAEEADDPTIYFLIWSASPLIAPLCLPVMLWEYAEALFRGGK